MGLKINIGKTEVQVISKKDIIMDITINNTKLKQVNDSKYLGGKSHKRGSALNTLSIDRQSTWSSSKPQ